MQISLKSTISTSSSVKKSPCIKQMRESMTVFFRWCAKFIVSSSDWSYYDYLSSEDLDHSIEG